VKSFNRFFSFLFINSKINSLLFWISLDEDLDSDDEPESKVIVEAIIAKSIYKKQIRRYFGLGFFLSFIPDTEPFKARENLLANIEILESFEDLIPGFMKTPLHIFTRNLVGPMYHHMEDNFITILRGNNDNFGGLNRLNPLLYPIQLILAISKFIDNILQDSEWEFPRLPLILKIAVYPILFILYCIYSLTLGTFLLLYFTIELILNTLNTLIVEPFQFAYEVIHQLISTWGLEFASMPTDDYSKVNQLLNAVDNTLMYEALTTDSLKIYQTTELTLIESTDTLINSMQKHRSSYFFQLNKDSDLFQKDDKTIADSYNKFTNLRQFSYFTHKEMPNEFPKELKQDISDLCFQEISIQSSNKNLPTAM
jgi:hypothetical protein